MSQTNYSVGLDIGSNSIGWVIVDDQGQVMHVRDQLGIGVRVFNAGTPAAERRTFRTTRRRLSRRRWRMKLLREYFDEAMAEIDPDFFRRLKYFGEVKHDPHSHQTTHRLFTNISDHDFYAKYPTIYHLRYHLMHDDRKFDLREIYLAIAHMMKYRGHFLSQGLASTMSTQKIDLSAFINSLNLALQDLYREDSFQLPHDEETLNQLRQLIVNRQTSRKDRAATIGKLLTVSVRGDKQRQSRNTNLAKAIGAALVGLKVRLDQLLNVQITKAEQSEWTKSFDLIDDFVAAHENELDGNAQNTILELVQKIYVSGMLTDIVPAGMGLSEAMMAKYQDHADDLRRLRTFAHTQDDEIRHQVMALYGRYINGEDSKPFTWEAFTKALKPYLSHDDSQIVHEIQVRIEAGTFMPKQRTKLNAMIPNQMQQSELDAILRNQGRFYKFLLKDNPVVDHRQKGGKDWLPFALDELISFRVDYFTGPLITEKQQAQSSTASFAWMKRHQDVEPTQITPWNYQQQVDRKKSAQVFIERMRTTDSYLIGEEVLPVASLLNQRFLVYNELQNVRINKKQPLTVKQRQRLYQQLFVEGEHKTVTVKQVKANLIAHSEIQAGDTVDGLADETKFLSQLGTYHDLLKIVPDAVVDPSRQSDLEQLIAWSTLFESGSMFREKLDDIVWLSDAQRNQLSKIRYRGWGKLSKKLLTEITDHEGLSIMAHLWQKNGNFSKLINQNDSEYAAAIDQENQATAATQSLEELIDAQYTSPVNKKALRQVMLVLKDIQSAFHGIAPRRVYIETADGTNVSQKHRRTVSRGEKLRAQYAQMAQELVDQEISERLDEFVADGREMTDKLYLYFSQMGRDAYTGLPIEVDSEYRMPGYDIDHIIPQRLLKDDSMANRVLVGKQINEYWKADDRFASREYGKTMGWIWAQWQQSGLISERKFANLLFDPERNPGRLMGFISRQLVETRQVIKLASQVIMKQYPQAKVIRITARMNHAFREVFHFPKIREANDYHHAFDAYSAAFLGNYLRRQYPKLAGFYEYDNYMPFELNRFAQDDINFVGKLRKYEKIKNANGEIVWQQAVDEPELRRIYDLKAIKVTHETYEATGGLFDQTMRPKSDSRKLVPLKGNKPTELYGGYQKPSAAFVSVVKVIKGIHHTIKVVPVYQLNVARIDRAKSPAETTHEIRAAIDGYFLRDSKVAPRYEILIERLRLGSKIQLPDGQQIMIISSQMQRNAEQFYVSRYEQLLLQEAGKPDNAGTKMDADLVNLYDDILTRAKTRLPLMAGHLARLDTVRDQFLALPINAVSPALSKLSVLKTLLAGLRPESSGVEWKKLLVPVNGYLGKFQSKAGVVLPENARIIHESPTGLFVHQQLIQ